MLCLFNMKNHKRIFFDTLGVVRPPVSNNACFFFHQGKCWEPLIEEPSPQEDMRPHLKTLAVSHFSCKNFKDVRPGRQEVKREGLEGKRRTAGAH